MNAIHSRRAYAFDFRLKKLSPHLRADRPIAELRALAQRIWRKEGRRGEGPTVVASRGSWTAHWGLYSYILMDREGGEIHLCRDNRNIAVVIHEMAHALGPWDKLDHGPAFRARHFRLLAVYGNADPAMLMAAGIAAGV